MAPYKEGAGLPPDASHDSELPQRITLYRVHSTPPPATLDGSPQLAYQYVRAILDQLHECHEKADRLERELRRALPYLDPLRDRDLERPV